MLLFPSSCSPNWTIPSANHKAGARGYQVLTSCALFVSSIKSCQRSPPSSDVLIAYAINNKDAPLACLLRAFIPSCCKNWLPSFPKPLAVFDIASGKPTGECSYINFILFIINLGKGASADPT